MQLICKAYAKRMQSVCKVYAKRMQTHMVLQTQTNQRIGTKTHPNVKMQETKKALHKLHKRIQKTKNEKTKN